MLSGENFHIHQTSVNIEVMCPALVCDGEITKLALPSQAHGAASPLGQPCQYIPFKRGIIKKFASEESG